MTRCPDAYAYAEIGSSASFISVKILMDSGASFSCLSFKCYQMLKSAGVVAELIATRFNNPVAADGTTMPIMGDVLLEVKFHGIVNGQEDIVHVTNCRFAIFKALSSDVIMGIDNLSMLQFEIGPLNDIKIGAARMSIRKERPEFPGMTRFSLISSVKMNKVKWCLYKPETELDSATDSISSRSDTKEVEMQDYLLLPLSVDQAVSDTILAKDEPARPPDKLCSAIDSDSNPNDKSELESKVDKPCEKIGVPPTEWKEFITQLASLSKFSKQGKRKLEAILSENCRVFSTEDTDVGEYKMEQVRLRLKSEQVEPAFAPSRRIPFALRDWLKKHLDKSLRSGIIEENKGSPYNSPLFLVKKPQGGWRPVSDFRLLNNQLVDNHWPLPLIKDLLDRLHGKTLFSTWDLRSGFYNIKLEPECRTLTSFTCMGKSFQFTILPQGIKVSPAEFQRIMEKIAGDLVPDSVSVYMDDLLCYSENENDALCVIQQILTRFREAGLKFNPKKCLLGQTEIQYLGYDISKNGWRPSKDKVKSLLSLEKPSTTTELRQFLGMANFHIASVEKLQIILGPMHKLTGTKKKTDLIEWTPEAEEAFEQAKLAVQNAVELSFFSEDPVDYLILTTDASLKGHAAVLSQFQTKSGREHLLGYSSGTFTGSQTRWPIFEMEMYAFVEGLRHNDTYLFGRRFLWRTDNKALSYFRSEGTVRRDSQRLAPKVARWLTYIEGFDFAVEHFGGDTNEMALADILSRNQKDPKEKRASVSSIINKLEFGIDPKVPSEENLWIQKPFGQINKDAIQTIRGDKILIRKFNLRRDLWFEIWSLVGLRIADVMDAQEADASLKELTGCYKIFRKPGFDLAVKVGLKMVKIRKHWLVVVPELLVHEVLTNSHGPNHNGAERMIESLRGSFWIHNCNQRIRDFVKKCPRCLEVKPNAPPRSAPVLQTSSEGPWISVHVDLAGPMTPSYDQNRYILVIIDSLTRFMEASAIPDKSADSVCRGILEIFARRGMPASVLADNGAEFKNKLLYDTLKRAGCHLQHTTPYSPRSNGLVERANQKIKRLFKLWECDSLDWEDHLSAIVYTINNTWNKNIKSTPWLCYHGWQNCDIFDRREIIKEDYSPPQSSKWAQQFVDRRNLELAKLYRLDVNRKLGEFSKLQNDYMKKANKSVLKKGDHCLVYQFQPKGVCGKIFSNWKGVYIIEEQVDKNVFLISLIGHRRRKFLIHRNRLRKIEDPKTFADKLHSGEDLLTEDSPEEAETDLALDKPIEEVLEKPEPYVESGQEKPEPGRLRSGRLFTKFD